MLTRVSVIRNLNYVILLLFLKIVTRWHWENVSQISHWVLKIAPVRVLNDLNSSKNNAFSVVKCLKVLTITAKIVQTQ